MDAPRSRPPPVAVLYTLGHSNHPIDHFLRLLHRHGVETVADVRSRPYSRFVPHFGKERLARILADAGMGYLFLGQELGGRPAQDDPVHARLDYRARITEPSFQQGIQTLLDAVEIPPRRARVPGARPAGMPPAPSDLPLSAAHGP